MDLTGSERVAMCATGVQNLFCNEQYIPKSRWDQRVDWSDVEEESNCSTDRKESFEAVFPKTGSTDYNHVDTMEIIPVSIVHPMALIHRNNPFNLSYQIPNIDVQYIGNIRLIIRQNNMDMTIDHITMINKLFDCLFVLYIGNMLIDQLSMQSILFYAHILGKKIIEYDDEIIIPIPVLNVHLRGHEHFPKYILQYAQIRLDICMPDKNFLLELENNSILRVDVFERQSDLKHILVVENDDSESRWDVDELAFLDGLSKEGSKILVYQTQNYSYYYNVMETCHKQVLRINHPSDFAIFVFDQPIELFSIKLFLNDAEPIVWNMEDGEIHCLNIYQKNIYWISFVPTCQTLQNIKKRFNSRAKQMAGINFSRIDSIKIKFDLESASDVVFVKSSIINQNVGRIIYGTYGISYAN